MEEHDERRWWILVVLCLSLVMVIPGNTVLNVAIIGACVAATGAVLVWRFLPDAHHLSTQTDETHPVEAEAEV